MEKSQAKRPVCGSEQIQPFIGHIADRLQPEARIIFLIVSAVCASMFFYPLRLSPAKFLRSIRSLSGERARARSDRHCSSDSSTGIATA